MKKFQWLALSSFSILMLVSCPPAPAPNGTSLGDTPTISGKIDAYNLGAGVLKINLPNTTTTVATGSVSAAGDFTVQLPGSAVMATYLNPLFGGATNSNGCGTGQTGSLTTSPANLKASAVAATIFASNTSTTPLGYLINGTAIPNSPTTFPATIRVAAHIFVLQDSTALGTCSGNGFTQSINLNLKTGWNSILLTQVFQSSTNAQISITSDLPSNDITWRVVTSSNGGGFVLFNTPFNAIKL